MDGTEIGKSHAPIVSLDKANAKKWKVRQKSGLTSNDLESSGNNLKHSAPFLVVGCDFGHAQSEFRDPCRPNTAFDELSIWTRELQVNASHNEIEYFLGGYGKNDKL